VRHSLEQAGNGIGPFDELIAGHALHAELIPATNNTREFSRVDGLTVEDWLLPEPRVRRIVNAAGVTRDWKHDNYPPLVLVSGYSHEVS
jgi:hypothetical protein